MKDTKEKILAAAEELFAERGYDATSLRAITAAAGVNLAAVNYHFSSKEVLLRTLFTRRLSQLNRERLAQLDACESETKGGPVPVERLVQAFIEPLFRVPQKPPAGSRAFAILLGRIYFSPSAAYVQEVASEIRVLSDRFRVAFRKTLPDLSTADLAWRIHFVIGAMAHALSGIGVLKIISQGACDPSDLNEAYRRLLPFVTAGIQAPALPERSIRAGVRPQPVAGRKGMISRGQISQSIQKQR